MNERLVLELFELYSDYIDGICEILDIRRLWNIGKITLKKL
jgi:hypothetical protein